MVFAGRRITIPAVLSLLFLLLVPAPGPRLHPAGDERIEVYDLRHYTHPNFTRIVVDIGGLREYTYAELHSPDRIFINIYQAKLNPILQGEIIVPNCDYLSQVRIAQRDPITVRVVADLSFDKIQSYRVFYLPDPFRIILDIYPRDAAEVPATAVKPGETPVPRPADPTASGQYTMARQLGLGVETVVLDPGHGGMDPGCLGLAGQKEKDVVLDIALRLRKLLEAAGLKVVMTRESDIYIKVETRCIPANNMNADLFVSIHANASLNRRRAGIETFYLNFSPDPSVNEVAAQENATSNKNLGALADIVKKITQNSKIPESRDLAQKVQGNLVQYLSRYYGGIKDLGAKGGPFWVLIGSKMPSVLVEVSHLSNSLEEARLKDAAYRQRIAQGIANGILSYRESLGKGKIAR
jgi:N-acetylmuramoyl-L-alanine amidase